MQVGGCEVDGHPLIRKVEPGIAHSRTNSVFRLLHGLVWQTDNREERNTIADIDFDLDDLTGEANYGAAVDSSKHCCARL